TAVIGYDEHFLFLQLVAHGYRIAYRPDAVVRHPLPDSVPELRRQYSRDLSAFVAYATLLFAETPFRGALGRFLWQAVRGTPRSWRSYTAGPKPPRLLSRAKIGLALASGPFRYLRGRITGRGKASQRPGAIPTARS